MTARERMKQIREKRNKDTVKRRSERKNSYSSVGDPLYNIKDEKIVKAMEIKDELVFRILPPTFDSADGHWGYEIHTHYQIGISNKAFNCPNKIKSLKCPICEEVDTIDDPKRRKPLYPGYGVLVYIIDRNDEKSGPKLWRMPFGVENDILTQASRAKIDYVDDEEEGFDITISYSSNKTEDGKQSIGKWSSCTIDRVESVLSEDEDQMDEWLDFINKNPLDKVAIVYDYEKIANCFNGMDEMESGSKQENKEKEDDSHSKMKKFRKF